MGIFSFFKNRKTAVYKKIDNGINQIKHGIYIRLCSRYTEKYNDDDAVFYAAAVTNELFSLPPTTEEAKLFLEKNRKTVLQELSLLKNDEDIKKAATHAIRIRMNVVYNTQQSGAYDKKVGQPYVRLVKNGLAMKEKEDKAPRDFIRFAEKFYRVSIKK